MHYVVVAALLAIAPSAYSAEILKTAGSDGLE